MCHTLGVALFVFKVLPNVENMFGLFLMNALCIVPAILKVIFASTRGMTRFKRFVTFLFDIIAIVCQLGCVVLFKTILAEQKVRFCKLLIHLCHPLLIDKGPFKGSL